jgi:hypothetical protein
LRLADLFENLPVPSSNPKIESFSSLVIMPGPHRLGKDARGAPALLVVAGGSPLGSRTAPVELENVRVMYDLPCLLWHSANEHEEARFSVVQCLSNDRILHAYFLSVIEGILPLLGSAPNGYTVHEMVDSLAELFRTLTLPPRGSVQGLWAELFMLTESSDPTHLCEAWHATPDDLFDFSASSQRIEVKSSGDRGRKHHFTSEQVHPPLGTRVLVASLFVERAGAGTSLAELIELLRTQVSKRPGLLMKIEQLVASSLGITWRNTLDQRFDRELAQDSLLFFDSQSIPAIGPEFPPGVSDVRFVSDLGTARPISIRTLLDSWGIYRSASPLRRAERRQH